LVEDENGILQTDYELNPNADIISIGYTTGNVNHELTYYNLYSPTQLEGLKLARDEALSNFKKYDEQTIADTQTFINLNITLGAEQAAMAVAFAVLIVLYTISAVLSFGATTSQVVFSVVGLVACTFGSVMSLLTADEMSANLRTQKEIMSSQLFNQYAEYVGILRNTSQLIN
jgi:hypothetical protein